MVTSEQLCLYQNWYLYTLASWQESRHWVSLGLAITAEFDFFYFMIFSFIWEGWELCMHIYSIKKIQDEWKMGFRDTRSLGVTVNNDEVIMLCFLVVVNTWWVLVQTWWDNTWWGNTWWVLAQAWILFTLLRKSCSKWKLTHDEVIILCFLALAILISSSTCSYEAEILPSCI